MLELLFSVMAALFSMLNPLGAVPVFLAMTPDDTLQERRKTARNTSLYVILILLSFFLGGTYILDFFGISLNAMRIAGGLIILISGYGLMSGQFAESRAINKEIKEEAINKEDISFTPMAMPMLAGPGAISLLIGVYAEHVLWAERLVIMLAVLLSGVLIYLILRSAPYLYRVLGRAGLKALSRIMGFLVMAIGIQYIIAGVVDLVKVLA